MTTANNTNLKPKKRNSKYRLVIINEQSYEEVFASQFTYSKILTMLISFFIVLIVLVTMLIAFTGLREFIPGYPDSNQRLLIVRNAQRVDSLIVEINRRDMFVNNIRRVLKGEALELSDTVVNQGAISSSTSQSLTFERSEEDSIFRKQVEQEEKFNLSVQQYSSRSATNLENIFFFSPIKGLVINPYGSSQGHYGVDIVATPGTRVSAVMEGVVISSGWTVETGYVIHIQHPNNLISIYKHNERLLKQSGDVVKAGETIAHVGNSGELTTGPHLHFELWHSGTPLNPQEYITF